MSNLIESTKSYLKQPSINPLTDNEKELAIAAFAALKEIDTSWKTQIEGLSHISINKSDNYMHNFANKCLLEIPLIMENIEV